MLFRKLLPSLLWALFILVLCGIPGNKIPELTFWQWLKPDKIVHVLIFGVQSYLLIKAFQSDTVTPQLRNHAVLLSLLITISYGAVTELLQTYVFINRYGDVRDAFANALGAVAGWYFYRKGISS